jgi:L,D-peptidoglycan transpeptidase YkuD (ErfK/YbiS/YcfS/YnhG family)
VAGAGDIALVTDGRRLRLPDGMVVPCAMGRSGLIDAAAKREGDGATPIGRWRLTRIFYRPDRMRRPAPGALPVQAIQPEDRWCDDPKHPAYNRLVSAPFDASCETLWRDDGLYDLIVETDHNSQPPVPGAGSAIFLHCRNPSGAPTAGCIALDTDVLARLLDRLSGPAVLDVRRVLG